LERAALLSVVALSQFYILYYIYYIYNTVVAPRMWVLKLVSTF
jgi:hypothetical protein